MNTSLIIQGDNSFEERMKSKIRESIGELLTDDELSEIVKKGVDDIFFKPSYIKNSYGSLVLSDKPLAVTILNGILNEKVTEMVKEYVNDNKEEISKEITRIVEQGMGKAFISAITSLFRNDLYTFQTNVMNSINRT